MYNAGLFLNSAWRALRTNGKLILTTPNAFAFSSMITAIFRGGEKRHPEHTCYYSAQTLSYLVSHHGFRVTSLAYAARPASHPAIAAVRKSVCAVRPTLGEILVLVADKLPLVDKYGDKW